MDIDHQLKQFNETMDAAYSATCAYARDRRETVDKEALKHAMVTTFMVRFVDSIKIKNYINDYIDSK